MASIWSDITLEWDDETVTVKPTLNFINKIEQVHGASLSLLLQRLGTGDIPIGISCHVIGTALREGGVAITNDEVYNKYFEIPELMGAMVGKILAGCMPMPKGVSAGK